MASKFAQFLKDNKIDPRRIVVASHAVEKLRPEDRRLKFQKRKTKASGAPAPAAAEGEAKPAKPRSGRPVTQRLLDAVTNGKPVTGPAKTRLLRAVNHVLEQKKKPAVDLRTVF